jgi:peptidyl-prolyl cis-trans isomerase SDCCAG10
MQDNLRNLKKRTGEDSDSDSDTSSVRRARKRRAGGSALEQELAKYAKGRGRAAARGKRGKRDDDEDLLREMGKFSKKVATAVDDEEGEAETGSLGGSGDEVVKEEEQEEGLEVDDDVGWMRHRLKFATDGEASRRAEDDYTVRCRWAFGWAGH